MIKSIKIDDTHELTLSNNIGWAMKYREQFGHDIIPDLLPAVSAIITLLGEANGKKFDIKKIDKDILQEALINLAGIQSVDFINLIWAMAKTADDSIKEPRKWVKEFDTFPLDIILPQAFNLLLEGLVSTKNLPRLSLAGATK
ncbi:MAG: hypothetical protein IIZ23_08030 [Ruminococcus sp.]|nr:hypothetical protein [Ruminococcus sp.]